MDTVARLPTKVVPQGPVGRLADTLMKPLMYWLQGTYQESPQETHVWNNTKLSLLAQSRLDHTLFASVPADPDADNRWLLGYVPTFHMPRFGGWTKYVVLEPRYVAVTRWYLGWHTRDVCGVSRIPITGAVRALRGLNDCNFFGLLPDGSQIALRVAGTGVIGDRGSFAKLPLR